MSSQLQNLIRRGTSDEYLINSFSVFEFSIIMSDKLEQKRQEGRGGWYQDNEEIEQLLITMLHDHVGKALDMHREAVKDPHQLVDLANLAMFLYHRTVTLNEPTKPEDK